MFFFLALLGCGEGVVCEPQPRHLFFQLPLLPSGRFWYLISLEIDFGIGIMNKTVLLGSIVCSNTLFS